MGEYINRGDILNLNMTNILILTPLYPASDLPATDTPVVHFFAKEWVKSGYNVMVFHYVSDFPSIYYRFASLFVNVLSSKVGFVVRSHKIGEKEYEIDGVHVVRIPLKKYIPHSTFSKSVMWEAYQKTLAYCRRQNFVPDCIAAHWFIPQLEMIQMLKTQFAVPAMLVLHGGGDVLKSQYKKEGEKLMQSVDLLGFRSDAIKRAFEETFNFKKPSFMCYSGIPIEYLQSRKYKDRIDVNKVIYVGNLIKRKYPLEVLKSFHTLGDRNFHLSYIGLGREEIFIKKYAKKNNLTENVHFLGRMNRLEVQTYLRQNGIFVMISRDETFGLVYLEAMAAGCITIASKDEGFDGIIRDGINGFLCKSGDFEELALIVDKIKRMRESELLAISKAAMDTAYSLSEPQVAENYIKMIEKYTL